VRGVPDSLAVLRERDYRLLFCGNAASLLGDGMVNVALAFAVLELGGSASAVGLVFASRTLSLVACLLIGGVVADRISRRAVMVGADLTRLASQGVLGALLITGGAHVWTLALLSGVTGAATGFFNPASTGLMPLVVAPDQLQQANGLRATAMAAGEILGPTVAGVLVATTSPGWALAIDAATFAVSAAFLSRLRLPPLAAREAATFLQDLRSGWGAFRKRTWVWSFVIAAALGNMVWGAWSVLGPVVAERDLGGAAAWGAALSAMGVGGVLGGVAAIRVRPRRPMVLVVATAPIYAVPLALLALRVPVGVLAVATFVSGVSLMLGNTVWESTLQRHIPAEALSRVSSYDWFGSLAFAPLGYTLWGPISVAIGIDASLWLAFALWVVVLGSLIAVPDIRRLTNDSGDAEAVQQRVVGAP
jgi:predicted MFS family arabinose efflux permease